MTWHGWLSLGVELLIIGIVLGALGRLGGRIYRLIRAEIRTARIQREIEDMQWPPEAVRERHAASRPVLDIRRTQLDGLATASDKASRRIVH